MQYATALLNVRAHALMTSSLRSIFPMWKGEAERFSTRWICPTFVSESWSQRVFQMSKQMVRAMFRPPLVMTSGRVPGLK